jgi:hypothetical protein
VWCAAPDFVRADDGDEEEADGEADVDADAESVAGSAWVVASALNSVDVQLSKVDVRVVRERDTLAISIETLSAKSVPVGKPDDGEWLSKVAELHNLRIAVLCTADDGLSVTETQVVQTDSCTLQALLPLLGPGTGDVRFQLSAQPIAASGGAATVAAVKRLLGVSRALEPPLPAAAPAEMHDRYAVVLARLLEQTDALQRENDEMRTTMAALTVAFERQTAVIELLSEENAVLLADLP